MGSAKGLKKGRGGKREAKKRISGTEYADGSFLLAPFDSRGSVFNETNIMDRDNPK